MTRFERDLKDALAGNEINIILRRREEIQNLKRDLSSTKNSYRATCISQDLKRLKCQLEKIENNF